MKRIVEDIDVVHIDDLSIDDIVGIQDKEGNRYMVINTNLNVISRHSLIDSDLNFVEGYNMNLPNLVTKCKGNGMCAFLFDSTLELVQWAFDIPQSTDAVEEDLNAVEETQTEHKYWCLYVVYDILEKGSIYIKTPNTIEEDEVAEYALECMLIDEDDCNHVVSVEEVDYKTYKHFTYC